MMNAKKFADASKKVLMPGRSLLLPMLLLALGLHAALLAMPIPSSEAIKEAEDKKNPITVNQIPTDQPTPAPPAANRATVNVPDMPVPETVSDSSAAAPATTETAASAIAADPTTSPSFSPKATKSSAPSSLSSASRTDSSSDPSPSATPAPETATEPEASATVAVDSAPETVSSAPNPFTEFPHFQPSEADCFGLGFGENCRVVDKGAIAQVTDYFKKELAAKDFTANLVADEPTRKVFKVTKGDKTLFLNIWQGNNQVSYLLSRVVVKQSPADIRTDGNL